MSKGRLRTAPPRPPGAPEPTSGGNSTVGEFSGIDPPRCRRPSRSDTPPRTPGIPFRYPWGAGSDHGKAPGLRPRCRHDHGRRTALRARQGVGGVRPGSGSRAGVGGALATRVRRGHSARRRRGANAPDVRAVRRGEPGPARGGRAAGGHARGALPALAQDGGSRAALPLRPGFTWNSDGLARRVGFRSGAGKHPFRHRSAAAEPRLPLPAGRAGDSPYSGLEYAEDRVALGARLVLTGLVLPVVLLVVAVVAGAAGIPGLSDVAA